LPPFVETALLKRLAESDIAANRPGAVPLWVVQVAVGVAAGGAATLARAAIELVAPGVVPFALLFQRHSWPP